MKINCKHCKKEMRRLYRSTKEGRRSFTLIGTSFYLCGNCENIYKIKVEMEKK